jgi:XTP/dITP diphosphohydrolase
MPTVPLVVLSSRNAKKIAEVVEQLAPHGIDVVGVSQFPDVPEVLEDGGSFLANASKKASEVAMRLGHWVIAEDSGLCVAALNGRPGVDSAIYAGVHGDNAANNQKLLTELQGVPPERRQAHYLCQVVLSNPVGEIVCEAVGTCGGVILTDYRGAGGFGFDPLFLVPEYHQTFGELPAVVKRYISHRAKAFGRFVPQAVRCLQSAAS